MPLAVTHVLLTIIVVDLYRDYVTPHKKYFSLNSILIAGVCGLLPDIDIAFKIMSSAFGVALPAILSHRGITHTLLFAFFFLFPGLVLSYQKKHKTATIFYIAAFGIFFHLLLDFFLSGDSSAGIMWFYPLTTVGWKLELASGIPYFSQALDASILLIWLWHEEVKHKIVDFI
jgi:membrane-bound metal-dependent hydrolase YbcI (DUF457 family)